MERKKKAHEDSHCWRFHSRSPSRTCGWRSCAAAGAGERVMVCFFFPSFSLSEGTSARDEAWDMDANVWGRRHEMWMKGGRVGGREARLWSVRLILTDGPNDGLQSRERVGLPHDHRMYYVWSLGSHQGLRVERTQACFSSPSPASPVRGMIMHKQQKGVFLFFFLFQGALL